jgi:hypothetical protein
MGIPFNQSFPKVIITNEASSYESLEGTTIDKSKMTFMAKIISLGTFSTLAYFRAELG